MNCLIKECELWKWENTKKFKSYCLCDTKQLVKSVQLAFSIRLVSTKWPVCLLKKKRIRFHSTLVCWVSSLNYNLLMYSSNLVKKILFLIHRTFVLRDQNILNISWNRSEGVWKIKHSGHHHVSVFFIAS